MRNDRHYEAYYLTQHVIAVHIHNTHSVRKRTACLYKLTYSEKLPDLIIFKVFNRWESFPEERYDVSVFKVRTHITTAST